MRDEHFQAAVIWGVMYTVSVTLLGLGLNHAVAWRFGVMTMALAFCTHAAAVLPVTGRLPLLFAVASWLTAAIAGARLFF